MEFLLGGFFIGHLIKKVIGFTYRTLSRFVKGGIRRGIVLYKRFARLARKAKRRAR